MLLLILALAALYLTIGRHLANETCDELVEDGVEVSTAKFAALYFVLLVGWVFVLGIACVENIFTGAKNGRV